MGSPNEIARKFLVALAVNGMSQRMEHAMSRELEDLVKRTGLSAEEIVLLGLDVIFEAWPAMIAKISVHLEKRFNGSNSNEQITEALKRFKMISHAIEQSGRAIG